jgi:predicted ATPase
MQIDNSAPNYGAQGNFYGPVTFNCYFGEEREPINQASLNADLQNLAGLVARSSSHENRIPPSANREQHVVMLATRDQASSAYYVAVVREFVAQHSASFTGDIFWFDQQAAGEDITIQVTRYGRAADILSRADFDILDQPQRLAAVQRAWQNRLQSLLIFSGIDSFDTLQQLGTVLTRPVSGTVLVISSWHELTGLVDLTGDRCMQLLNAEQVDVFFKTILAATPDDQPAEALFDPCLYLEAFPRVAAAETEDSLVHVFREPDMYSNLISTMRRPGSHAIFGGKGSGKTALCKRLEHEYRGHNHVLTVRLRTDSFQQYVRSGQPITVHSWLNVFIPQLLNALLKRLRHDTKRRQKLQQHRYEADQLMGLCAFTHADPPKLQEPPDINALCERIKHRDSFERLEMFAEILKSAGFAYALILIDDINNQIFETDETQAHEVIAPLVQSFGSVQDYLLAIKLFLPDTLRDSIAPALMKFMDVYEITWTDDDLREMVRLRLAQSNLTKNSADERLSAGLPLDYPECFDLLCESNTYTPGESIENMLIRLAHRQPGRLMHIISRILARHCTARDSPRPALIRRSTINNVLNSEWEIDI